MIIGLVYGLIFILPRVLANRRDAPKRELAAFRSVVNENYLLMGTFSSLDGSQVTAAQSLQDTRSHLEENLKRLTDLAAKPPKTLDSASLEALQQVISQERQLLEDYDARYDALDKPITYIALDDFGQLDLEKDTDEAIKRANAASEALQKLADSPDITLKNQASRSDSLAVERDQPTLRLSDESLQALAVASRCFQDLGSDLKTRDIPKARTTLTRCNDSYKNVRQTTINAVTATFETAPAGQITEQLKKLLEDLSKAVEAL